MSEYLLLNNVAFEYQNFEDEFLLLKTKQNHDLAALGKAILDQQFKFIDEVISCEQEICLKINEHFDKNSLDLLDTIKSDQIEDGKSISLPVLFSEKDDWDLIKKQTGISRSAYIEKLTSKVFKVAMFGFLPGFVYLNGLSKDLFVPRKITPSKYIRPNVLAIGENYLGIYSLPSPGGWNVIGDLACSILDLTALPPNFLNPSDEIKLVAISLEEFDSIRKNNISLSAYNGSA